MEGSCGPSHAQPLYAELRTILFGKEQQPRNVILETDCIVVVSEVAKIDSSFSEWYPIIKDISTLQKEFFSFIF